ncbi:unnamed protein product [Heterosigma akashiwo]|mmetsp:Transcript_2527/g.3398  ORF Transcript_2527/g.3398 Transcript_2527/m.3398 type:complete len:80 (-) Transcript_2527:248-487(-)|eukprot:CAMPEP_0194599552 /NCGR_PEP_ID=MMETSP0292-20121207/27733_1 /TAXON_ID=39354 /ORGANISM="Heterosigma akashiwo, Strain CCMP2393" /LENGTH=79 /DNA_ID=CAMNT_0039460847 /DNA_START=24 /DNA_END=263 /DNA_ORIENTATION=+
MNFSAVLALLVAAFVGTMAFQVPQVSKGSSVIMFNKIGAGGMADTRDPEPKEDLDDPRKSIKAAPSFEEYMKQKQAQGN